VSDNAGLFKAAHGGTLFLDEIADLALSMQVKLLRVIQEKTIRPVGSQQEEVTNVRIISASHKDLESMVKQGTFRQDLYYRINVIGVSIPTLSQRQSDIEPLTRHILEKHYLENNCQLKLDSKAMEALRNYSFPGNVRELENILERATVLSDGDTISVDDLQLPETPPTIETAINNLGEMIQSIGKEKIVQALTQNRWNQSATARDLGITLRQLRYKMEKLELNKL